MNTTRDFSYSFEASILFLIYAKNLPVEYIALHLRKATCSIKMSIIVL